MKHYFFSNAILVCASHKESIVDFDQLYLNNILNFLNLKKHLVAYIKLYKIRSGCEKGDLHPYALN